MKTLFQIAVIMSLLFPACSVTAQNVISFNICSSVQMSPSDLAGAGMARVPNWNNVNVKSGNSVTLDSVVGKDGKVIPMLTVTITGGHSSLGSFDWSPASGGNDAKMFNGFFDQEDGSPTNISITGIPFAKYDVYFYRCDDNEKADQRAGEFQIADKTLFTRGGKGTPTADGKGYFCSSSTTEGTGKDIQQGNYVKFEGLSGPALSVSLSAVSAGDDVQRNKVAGFQIVERK